ncbi:MAG: hypothetical protein IJH50_02335 [Kiritimatiellae bacterium]|nr:hypothetical protein [Kiritimatiellia bacterium]
MKLLVSSLPYDGGKSDISVYVREVVRALLERVPPVIYAPRWTRRPGRLWKRYAYGLVKSSWLSIRTVCGGC